VHGDCSSELTFENVCNFSKASPIAIVHFKSTSELTFENVCKFLLPGEAVVFEPNRSLAGVWVPLS